MSGSVRVLGAGSPHGDDRAAWVVVERLRAADLPGVEARCLDQPLALLDHLDGCSALVVVDACRTGGEPGSVLRLTWPDDRLESGGGSSSHGLGMAAALALAEKLGRLPPVVVLLAIEAAGADLGTELSEPVQGGLETLWARLLAEVQRLTL